MILSTFSFVIQLSGTVMRCLTMLLTFFFSCLPYYRCIFSPVIDDPALTSDGSTLSHCFSTVVLCVTTSLLLHQPSVIELDLFQVFRSVGHDGCDFDGQIASAFAQFICSGLSANSHAHSIWNAGSWNTCIPFMLSLPNVLPNVAILLNAIASWFG